MAAASLKLGEFSTAVEEALEILAARMFRNLNANWYPVEEVAVGAGRAPMKADQAYWVAKVPRIAHIWFWRNVGVAIEPPQANTLSVLRGMYNEELAMLTGRTE